MMSSRDNKKLYWTLLIIIILIITVIPTTRRLLFEDHLFKIVDVTAQEYVEEGLIRAAAAFATARSFNAIVSVFQESQLQLEPGGVGVSLALGAALDPINDLVERFSWVMLASLTSLGIQKILIEVTPFLSIQVLLILSLLFFLVGLWIPWCDRKNLTHLGRILLFSAFMLRLAVPCMAFLNQQVYVAFLEEQHDQSIGALGQTVSKLEQHQIAEMTVPQIENKGSETYDVDKTWWDDLKIRFNETVDQSKRVLDIRNRLESIKQLALEMIDKIVDLIVVFVLNTIVLPILFLWGLVKLGTLMVNRGVTIFPDRGQP